MSWKALSKFRSELMGLACLWVMLHHNSFTWTESMDGLRRFALYGNLGVDIFLLLSGVGLYYAWSKKPALGDFYALHPVINKLCGALLAGKETV